MYNLELPYPPSINHYWRHTLRGHVYISQEGKSYIKRVSQIVMLKRIEMLEGDLSLSVDVYPPDNRKRDLDNVLKALLDAMQKANVYADDNQICKIHVMRMKKIDRSFVDIAIGKIVNA